MAGIKKSAQDAIERGRSTATRVGKVAKSATVVAAKAGAAAAADAGKREFARGWEESRPSKEKMRKGAKIAGAVAGAAALVAAGVAIGRAREKKKKAK